MKSIAIPKFTEKDIYDIADTRSIVGRGIQYYHSGAIRSMKIEEDAVIAKVQGTRLYTTTIYFDDGVEGECDCPYGYGCKHVVAVLYKLLREQMPPTNSQQKLKTQIRRKQPAWISHDQTLAFTNSLPKKTACLAFDIARKNSDIELVFGYNSFTMALDDSGPYKVTVEKGQSWMRRNFSGSCDRCKIGQYYGEPCKHILAAVLVGLQKQGTSFEIHERKIRQAYEKECYDQLASCLETLDIENKQSVYQFFFSFEWTDGISICLQKAPILKNGSPGKISKVRENFLSERLPELPKNERITIELFLLMTKKGNNWNHSDLKVTDFSGGFASELLMHLRDISKENPHFVKNCAVAQEKAEIELSLNLTDHGAYGFKVMALYQGKQYPIQPDCLLGKNPLWLFIKEEHVLIELSTDQPEKLRMLAQNAKAVLPKKQLEPFISAFYHKLSQIGQVKLPSEYIVEERIVEPKPRIFLKDHGSQFSIDLRFLYDSEEVSFQSSHELVVKKKNTWIKIQRDKEKEGQWLEKVLQSSVMEQESILVPSIDPYEWLADKSKELIAVGFEIFGADQLFNHRVLFDEPQLKITVSSGIDWFDLEGDASFGNEKVPLSVMLTSLHTHERFIKLSDGRYGIIPKKWLEKFSGVAGLLGHIDKGKRVRASSKHLMLVESLLDISKKATVDETYSKIREKFKAFNGINDMPLPKGLQGKLREYQKAGYNWLHFLKEFSFNGCLADEMGLGKTIQALSMLLHEKELGNTTASLIVAPTSLIFNWEKEIQKFAPSMSFYTHHGTMRKRRNLPKTDIIITTYGTMRNDVNLFSKKLFHYIILDESQQIKNPLSKNAQSAHRLQSKHKLVLTGTPIENNSLELWSQFAFLNPGLLGNMEFFKKTFATKIDRGKDAQKMSALHNMVYPFLLCRKKEQVAKDLPQKQVSTLYCEMDEKQQQIYDFWKEKFRAEILHTIEEEGMAKSRMKILQGLTKLRQICNHPKLIDESYAGSSGKFELLMDHLKEVIAEGHKILVFSSFVKMLRVIKEQLVADNIPFSYLDGSTTKRKEAVEEFQQNEGIRVFLLSLKAGNLGLNLTEADYVFIVDPWWNPAAEMQAIDRTHRIGQQKSVFVYKTITKDSIEEKIVELQEKKLELVKNIISIDEGIFKNLTRQDIENMFS